MALPVAQPDIPKPEDKIEVSSNQATRPRKKSVNFGGEDPIGGNQTVMEAEDIDSENLHITDRAFNKPPEIDG